MSFNKINYADFDFKILFMFFIAHMFEVLGIDEEVDEILFSESLTLKHGKLLDIFHHIMDLPVLTKSNKIYLFEFKRGSLRKEDFKQLYTYFKNLECREEREVIPVLLTIPKEGNINNYSTPYVTFHPPVMRTKNIDIRKDLLTIRNKFSTNQMLTEKETSVIVGLPLFDSGEDEGELIEEFCHYIVNNKENFPEDLRKYVIMGLFLGIVGYVDENKHEELMELMNVTTVYKGAVREIEKRGEKRGERRGERRIISRLLKRFTYPQIANALEMDEVEVRQIMSN